MSSCDRTDAGQKVEELRCALERSQAFLADLEERHKKPIVDDKGAECNAGAPVHANGHSDDDGESMAKEQSTTKSVGGLKNIKSKLTQWFSIRSTAATAATTATAVAEPALRRLSFSRVNIEFHTDAPAASAAAAAGSDPDDGPPGSPQPAWRLQRSMSSARRGPPSPASTKRTVSFNAAASQSLMYGGPTSPLPAALAPQPKPHPPADALAAGAMPSPRRASFDIGAHRSQGLVPTLSATSALYHHRPQQQQQQQHHHHHERRILRDTVWSSSPGCALGTLQSSSSFRTHSAGDDDAGTGIQTLTPTPTGLGAAGGGGGGGGKWSSSNSNSAAATVPCNVLRDRAVTDSNMSALLPSLQGTSSKSSHHLYGTNDANQRPQPQLPPSPSEPSGRAASREFLRAKSFTQGTRLPLPGGRAAAVNGGSGGPSGSGDAAGGGSGGSGWYARRRASLLTTWSERGMMVPVAAPGEGEEEEEGSGDDPLLPGHVWAQEELEELSPPTPQQQQQQSHHNHHNHHHNHHNHHNHPALGVMRLAGIPEVGRVGLARGLSGRCGSDTAVGQFIRGAPAAGAGGGGGSGGAVTGEGYVTAARGRGTRRQTWSNEVFVPVAAAGRGG